MTNKITDRQRNFLLTLAEERELPTEADKDRLLKMLRISEDPEELGMTKDTASKTIEYLLDRPRVSPNGRPSPNGRSRSDIEEPGVFEIGDDVFIVKSNRAGTRLYAKKLVEAPSERLTEEGDHVHFDFEYAPGAMAFLREEHRMDIERGKELAIRYGRCINCGRRLKVAESVERGIGPVCIKRFAGWSL